MASALALEEDPVPGTRRGSPSFLPHSPARPGRFTLQQREMTEALLPKQTASPLQADSRYLVGGKQEAGV